MIVISTIMAPADSPRLNLATTSRDFLATVDYPLRPAVARTWGKPQRRRNSWKCCYFPQSFPVYRMQRLVSVLLCLLGVVLLSVVAFVLVQVTPPQILRGRFGYADGGDGAVARESADAAMTQGGLEVVRTARKLEDHPEYRRSLEDDYNSEDEGGEEEDEADDLVLTADGYDDDGYESEEDDDYNPVFDMDYFDFSITGDRGGKQGPGRGRQPAKASTSTFKTPRIREKWKNLPRVSLKNDHGMKVVEDGVVFSAAAEDLLKESHLSDTTVGEVQAQLRSHKVVKLEEPNWEKCGRPKNQWVELSTGGAACARYRYPDDYLLVGEVLSFYLSRVLGVGHVPPVVLAAPAHPRWSAVASDMSRAGWGDAPVVVLTPWVERLVRDRMPTILLDALLKDIPVNILGDEYPMGPPEVVGKHVPSVRYRLYPPAMGGAKKSRDSLKTLSERELAQLVQWSDLLVFDYLTGNYDRLAYMQDAAEKEGRPQILSGTIHNLVRSEATDALWLLDNESGLMDAYSLLYGASSDPAQASRFQGFHTRALRSMCLFRRSTMEAVLGLASHPEPHSLLVTFLRENEPLAGKLPDPLGNPLFVRHFAERVREVHSWMVKCTEIVQKRSKGRRTRR
ncbi:extracellular serine/threonine protein kinase four-jointed-like [Penaeus monodon]|uniref:extracellular serine/threonine protein kinase four-jointed-like n=1 Tax=Penaeus monodon TaxID=6687 RepID=UPI0018A75965|nr:extracellular serine/threonine protein kinase four-jointed-like [Penaeus monodon]XP_037772849.1 extracellular serine/threonine protein kinase four-jointed-like [Penaeus monodon]XP_037772850.1 extracellular serine/threonine protein kinase four-jointed-like [Penaeus monodon]